MTPKLLGDIIRPRDRDLLRAYLQPYARIIPSPKCSDANDLEIGSQFFEKYRYAYGYLGIIKRMGGTTVRPAARRCHFARVLAIPPILPILSRA